jgi:hypothetical protein
VLTNIYALGRIAQVTEGYNGPRLGVKFSIPLFKSLFGVDSLISLTYHLGGDEGEETQKRIGSEEGGGRGDTI